MGMSIFFMKVKESPNFIYIMYKWCIFCCYNEWFEFYYFVGSMYLYLFDPLFIEVCYYGVCVSSWSEWYYISGFHFVSIWSSSMWDSHGCTYFSHVFIDQQQVFMLFWHGILFWIWLSKLLCWRVFCSYQFCPMGMVYVLFPLSYNIPFRLHVYMWRIQVLSDLLC